MNNATYNALRALSAAFPEALDDYLRSPSDAPDDHIAAYERARDLAVIFGATRVAWLCQHALEIGFRAGRGGTTDSVRQRESSEDYALGREAGLKEGRKGGLRDGKQSGRRGGKVQGLRDGEVIGFEKGKKEGLSEGKRLGFVAGRDFGEKQAAKLSIVSASDRSPASPISPLSQPLQTALQQDSNTMQVMRIDTVERIADIVYVYFTTYVPPTPSHHNRTVDSLA